LTTFGFTRHTYWKKFRVDFFPPPSSGLPVYLFPYSEQLSPLTSRRYSRGEFDGGGGAGREGEERQREIERLEKWRMPDFETK
jgi:hypothetical protein